MRPIKFRMWEEFPKYEIGDDGSVWSLNYNNTGGRREMKQYPDQDGYPYLFMVVDGRRYKRLVHRLVLRSFVPQPSPRHQVNHKNGVRHDNRLENLEWVTPQENTIDGWRRGRVISEKQRLASSKNAKSVNRRRWGYPIHENPELLK